MIRLFSLVLIVSTVVAVGLKPELSSAQELVIVQGKVINGTGGAEPPVDLPVLVLAMDQDDRVTSTGQALTGENGGFKIKEVPLLDAGQYFFSVDYSGVLYSEILSPEQLLDGVEILVYETTQDVAVVHIQRQVLVIAGVDRAEREISAIEFVLLANESDRTLLPDVSNPAIMSFLRFSLPPNTYDLNVQSNLPSREVISVGSGFAITSPVIPGGHSVEFSYIFPYEGKVLSYRQPLLQGADVYQVLVPERLAPLRVGVLNKIDPIQIQDTEYQAWESRDVSPGQGVVLELLELPQPSIPDRFESAITSTTLWRVLLPGALGAFLMGLLALGALRGRVGQHAFPTTSEGPRDHILANRDRMVQEISDLDDRFERGEMMDAEYRERRQALMSRILDIVE